MSIQFPNNHACLHGSDFEDKTFMILQIQYLITKKNEVAFTHLGLPF